MTNTGPPRARGGQHAPKPIPGEPAPSVPRPAAALIDIALLTGPFLSMGRPVSRNSVRAGFGVWRSWAPSGAQGRATWA